MLNPFANLPAAARGEQLTAYRQYLSARDGVLDSERHQLSLREERMRHLDRVTAFRSLDRDLFDAQYGAFDAARETPKEMLILLGLVKANAAESYGVKTIFDKSLARFSHAREDDTELMLLVEESYHTRILLSATRVYGFEVTGTFDPPLGLRTMVATMGSLPTSMTRPLVLATEVLGAIWFTKLFFLVDKLLAEDPELRDAVQERLVEVLIDEVGHVTYNQLRLGALGLAQARALLPVVARGMHGLSREVESLGLYPTADVGVLANLPEEVRRAAFVVRLPAT